MSTAEIKLEPSWKSHLLPEFEQPYMQQLKAFLQAQRAAKQIVYPRPAAYFEAFNLTPFHDVKVVILGQDPYHGPGQAHGLCFSVPPGVAIPPSLRNMYKELADDLGIVPVKHGYLTHWAKQGVLLLNSVLTVQKHQAASHQGKGWEQFTDAAIAALNRERDNIVFLLWGSYAQKKGQFIDTSRHLVLKSPHPSPLSASRGFFGNKHFSRANAYLSEHHIAPIDWQLPTTADVEAPCFAI